VEIEIKDPNEDALIIEIISERLVYRHIPLYNPKIKKDISLEIRTIGKYFKKSLIM
tara:strand:+ start:3939 stop:4106 length:168 start_codon:yes stop_codon:yes gene_type:complete